MALSWQQLLRPTLDQLWNTIPVPVFDLAEHYSIRIHRRFLPDRVAAILHRLDDDWYLYLNATHSRERQRFTVAHELSHVISYRNGHSFSTPNFCVADREHYTDSRAAEILMPAWKVRWLISKNVPLSEMAEKFAVSQQAMRIRIGEVVKEERRRLRRDLPSVLSVDRRGGIF